MMDEDDKGTGDNIRILDRLLSIYYRNIFILKEESCNMNDFHKMKIWILYYIIFLKILRRNCY